jgi:hypothetical protein
MGTAVRRVMLALMIGLGGTLPAAAQSDYEALPEGENKDLVYGLCAGCHSIKLVTQQGMPRSRWEKTLEWMYEEQGMPQLDDEIEADVLDYLAEHFNVDRQQQNDAPGMALSPYGGVQPLMPPQ